MGNDGIDRTFEQDLVIKEGSSLRRHFTRVKLEEDGPEDYPAKQTTSTNARATSDVDSNSSAEPTSLAQAEAYRIAHEIDAETYYGEV